MITNKINLTKYNLTESQLNILNSIEFNDNEVEFLKKQIRKYLNNNLPIEFLKQNFNEIIKLGKDSSSLRSYIIRYGEEIGVPLFNEKTKKSTLTKNDYISRYGEEVANQKLSSRGASLENYINRHGEELGRIKWQEYLIARQHTYSIGKTEKRYASRNLAWYQNKYGEAEGYYVWDKKRKDQAYKVSREYYIERYGEVEGRRLCAESKTRSLAGFIRKYGDTVGTEKYNNWVMNVVSAAKCYTYSKWATECCDILKESIVDLYYYGANEMIWQLPPLFQEQLKQKIISPDLFYRGKIIEFHGDIFHGNPLLFGPNEKIHPYNKCITVQEQNQIDKIRREYYLSKGYQVLEIWEYDYKQNKQEVVTECLTFLK